MLGITSLYLLHNYDIQHALQGTNILLALLIHILHKALTNIVCCNLKVLSNYLLIFIIIYHHKYQQYYNKNVYELNVYRLLLDKQKKFLS